MARGSVGYDINEVMDTSLHGVVKSTVVTVGTTAVPLPATPLEDRRAITIQAASTNSAPVFIGGTAVTADTAATGGLRLAAGESLALRIGDALIYARSTTAGQLVAVLEAS